MLYVGNYDTTWQWSLDDIKGQGSNVFWWWTAVTSGQWLTYAADPPWSSTIQWHCTAVHLLIIWLAGERFFTVHEVMGVEIPVIVPRSCMMFMIVMTMIMITNCIHNQSQRQSQLNDEVAKNLFLFCPSPFSSHLDPFPKSDTRSGGNLSKNSVTRKESDGIGTPQHRALRLWPHLTWTHPSDGVYKVIVDCWFPLSNHFPADRWRRRWRYQELLVTLGRLKVFVVWVTCFYWRLCTKHPLNCSIIIPIINQLTDTTYREYKTGVADLSLSVAKWQRQIGPQAVLAFAFKSNTLWDISISQLLIDSIQKCGSTS